MKIIEKNIHTLNRKKNGNISFSMLDPDVYNELREVSK